MPKAAWIGLAEVAPKAGRKINDKHADGAFVQVVGMAGDRREFRRAVADALSRLDLALVRLQESAPLATRCESCQVEPRLLQLASEVRKTGGVKCFEFHPWQSERDEASDMRRSRASR